MPASFDYPRSTHFVWSVFRYIPQLSLVLVFVLIAALLAFPDQVAQAATIMVTTTADELNADGDCSLREAIRSANLNSSIDACVAGSGADTINLPAGTFTLTREGVDDTASLGDLDLIGALTLTGTGAASSIIDGNQLDRIFDVQPGATVTIRDMTIRNGSLVTGPMLGAGIKNRGVLSLIDTAVRDNTAGGNTDEDGNFSDGTGGGVANDGTLSIVRGNIQGNRAYGAPRGGGGTGGGLANISGTATLTDVSIAENDAWPGRDGSGRGGGIANLGGNVVATNTMVIHNDAGGSVESEGFGGGIFNSATMTLKQSTVNDNLAGGGVFGGGKAGGIYNAGTLTANNSTISGNHSFGSNQGGVGGVDNAGGELILNNVTLSNNRAASDALDRPGLGGLVNGTSMDDGSMGVVTLSNTILANNTNAVDQPSDCEGSLQSLGYNLIEQVADCTLTGTTTGNLLGVDPQLGPLQDNGGPTTTQALLPGSPAIDAGNPAVPGSSNAACAATDQRSIPRPQDGNADGTARCDIGAYERQVSSTYVVINVAASCTYDEYADEDTIVTRMTFTVAGGPVTLDQLTATLVGATGGNVTYAPNLVGGTLQPGTTTVVATFRDYTLPPTPSEIRVTVSAQLNGSTQSVTSEPAVNCERQSSPSPSPSPKPVTLLVFLPMVQHAQDR